MHLELYINNSPISVVNSVKYLGVTISSDLSWSTHIKSKTKAGKRYIGLLHRQATPQARHAIYKAAILPKLEDCSSVWDPHQRTLAEELKKTQLFAGRVIAHKWKADYCTIRTDLNWHTLERYQKNQRLKMCFNILNNYSCIPPTTFIPHPPLAYIAIRPFYYLLLKLLIKPLFSLTLTLWNLLPQPIVNCLRPTSCKSYVTKLPSLVCAP